jgi:hypothetical protein
MRMWEIRIHIILHMSTQTLLNLSGPSCFRFCYCVNDTCIQVIYESRLPSCLHWCWVLLDLLDIMVYNPKVSEGKVQNADEEQYY